MAACTLLFSHLLLLVVGISIKKVESRQIQKEALWRRVLVPASRVPGSAAAAAAAPAAPAPGLPPAPGRRDPQLHTGQQLRSLLQADAEIRGPTSNISSWHGTR